MTKEEQENKKKPNLLFRIIGFLLRTIGWFLIGAVLLVIVALVVIQTKPAKRKMVEIAEQQVSNILNAELSIGNLSGNFFNNLRLDNVLLKSAEHDTIAYIESLGLKYKLYPLLSKQIIVNELSIDNPSFYLSQLSDSTWNIQHIVKPTNKQDTTTSTFDMAIIANKITLNNGKAKINSFEKNIPKQVTELFLDASGRYTTQSQEVNVKEIRFNTFEPNFELRQLALHALATKDSISLSGLSLETKQNNITASGLYNLNKDETSKINLHTSPIYLEEFQHFLPDNFHIKTNPQITLDAQLKSNELLLDLALKDKEQEIVLNVLSHYLLEYLSNNGDNAVTYDMKIKMKQVHLQEWVDNKNLDYTINGTLTAEGKGFDPETLKANVKGNFSNLVVQNNNIQKLNLLLNYNAGDVGGNLDGKGDFGTIYLEPDIKKILSKNPSYKLDLNTEKLDLSMLTGDKGLKSNLNVAGKISGTGLTVKTITATAQLNAKPSEILGIHIDTLNTDVSFAKQNLTINTFLLKALSAEVHAKGNYNLIGNSDLTLDAQLANTKSISTFTKITNLDGQADLQAHLSGQPDSLNGTLMLNVRNSRFQDIRVDSVFVDGKACIRNKDINIEGDLYGHKLNINGFDVDNVRLHTETDTKNFKLSLDAQNKDIQTHLNSMIELGDIINIALSDLWVKYQGYNLRQATDTSYLSIGKDDYKVSNFQLYDSINPNQTISANGEISRTDHQDFKIMASGIDLARLGKLFLPKEEIGGLLNLNLQVAGNAASPLVTGELTLDSTVIQKIKLNDFHSHVAYQEKELKLWLDVVLEENGKISAEGKIPAEMRIDSMLFNFSPKKTDPISLKLLIDEVPLSILNIAFPTDETAGKIESNISIAGTMGDPDISGNLNIVNGMIKNKLYGIDYKKIETQIDVHNNKINVDNFVIQSAKGAMEAKGKVSFETGIYTGNLNESDLKIKFNRFSPMNHKFYNIELTGDVGLNGLKDSLYFSGDLAIPESQVYLPALMSLFGKISAQQIPKPLLVLEHEKNTNQVDSVVYTIQPDSIDLSAPRFDFMKNLQGKLNVEIPRNTWIKNDDMRLELSGDLEVRKQKEYFEIFGTIDVVRGQYNLLGKVFVIQSGNVKLQGGETINPVLNIDAVHSLRLSDGSREELGVSISGEVNSLDIKFNMKGEQLTEGDALSYILFGTKLDDISSALGSENAGGAQNVAGSLAASLISSQLTKLLGNSLKVDYIEFKSSGSFQNASIVVGKYLTNKLFVSYEQNIGNLDNLQENTPRFQMALEYELFKFLFLQLASSPKTNGFDVIFKLNTKPIK